MKRHILNIIVAVIFISIYSIEALAQDSLNIKLVYPQNSNAPKREVKKIEKTPVVKDNFYINVTGINPDQMNNPELYIEYFLDSDLIHSTQKDKEKSKTKKSSFEFVLDTRLYPDGKHTLVANLWDPDGPSAIGIQEVIIQNQTEE